MSLTATRKSVAWSIGAVLLGAVWVTASLWAYRHIELAAEARQHTYIVMDRANELLSELRDAESGQRGYLLTGDEAFLEPYLAARDSMRGDLATLHGLATVAAARQHLDTMVPLFKARLADLAQVIEARRSQDPAGHARIAGHGKELMDEIRAEMRSFINIEEAALAQRDASFQSDMRVLLVIVIVANLMTPLLAIVFVVLIRRDSVHRVGALAHRHLHQVLDLQAHTNRQLEQANATLQASEEKLAVTLHSIGDAVIATDVDGRVTLVNPRAEQLTGWTQTAAVDRPVEEMLRIINQDTRQPVPLPVTETLAQGTTLGLPARTVLVGLDGSERAIADTCAPIRNHAGQVVGTVLVFRDVTERTRGEEAQRKNDADLRAVLDATPFPVALIDAHDNTIDFWSQSAVRLFGYTAPTASEWFQMAYPDPAYRRQVEVRWNAALEEARLSAMAVNAGTYRIACRDGSVRTCELYAAFLADRLIVTFNDNTARNEAEDALLQTGALQRAIFNSANFSSIATDAQGVIQIFNVGAERMLGYTAAEVLNTITPAEISDPQEVVARATALSAELGTPIAPGFEALVFKASRGIEDIYELTYIRKDGSRFPAVVSVTALRDAQQAIIGYLLIGTDNTARQQIEEERMKLDQRLRDQHFYTRSLIESNIDALMTTDPLGIITDINKQTEALTGCTRDELIGAPFKNCFTDAVRAQASITRVLNEGRVTNYELTARARGGKETVVSYNATTFYDRDRRLQGVVAASRDVTELKRFERDLQQKNAELEDASRLKSEFLANMSHELRTPLNAIIGFSEVLRDGLMGDLTEQQRGFVGDIFSSGQHLLSLINDILDLSKVEAGKMTLELEAVKLSSLLMDSLSIVREKAAAHHVSLTIEADEDLGSIQVDVRKVKQIMYNLLSNAVKFSRNGDHVTLRARRVPRADVGHLSGSLTGRIFPLGDSPFPEFLEIGVTDSGIGIAPDGLGRLFQPFSQIDSGLARQFEGTGLGLAMVKLLAELHDGTVAVESAEGRGSCFTVWLPMRGAEEANGVPAAAPAAVRADVSPGVRVALVVEDDLNSAEVIRVQLEAEGFVVIHAASAEAGLVLAVQQPLSLITMDIMLPGMDGWEFLARLRQLPNLSCLPVVMISIAADRNKGLLLGASAVMQKPISRQGLHDALAELGVLALSRNQTFTVLVVDDDPRAVELIAVRILALAGTVLRAYGGREAIDTARRELPDLIVLDLMMPEVNGFDVVEALSYQPDTAKIPVIVLTAKEIAAEDRARLSGPVTQIMDKTTFNRDRFATELRRVMSLR